jgi:hypothetical protein
MSYKCKGCEGNTPDHMGNNFPGDGRYCPDCTDMKSKSGRGTFVADTPSSLGMGGFGMGGFGMGSFGMGGFGGPKIPDAVLLGLITGNLKDPKCVNTPSGWVCSAKKESKSIKKGSKSSSGH